nr:hypothetical protein [Tanacetum cinerariifolium]
MYRESSLKCIKTLDKELETLKLEKDGVDGKLAGLLKTSKNLNNLIENQIPEKINDGLGYNVVPPPIADLYLSPKKDLSWTGLPEFADDTVTDYSRPSPTVESTSEDGQNRNSSASKNGEPTDSILSKPAVKFVKAVDRPAERPTTNKAETVKKPNVKYAEMYRRSLKKPTACYNCGDFNHLKKGKKGTSGSQNGAPMRPPHRPADHRPHGAPMRPLNKPVSHRPHDPPMRPMRSNMNGARPNITSFNKQAHSYSKRPFQETTQELMIILIQRVQRLKRELKARAPIHKEDRGRSRPRLLSATITLIFKAEDPYFRTSSGARPNRSFFIQAHSYKTRPFLKTSAVKTQYRAPWVSTVNRNNPHVKRKFSTGRRNFPTANRKFPTASKKFPTGSTKFHTTDMGRKGKAGSSQNNIDDKGYWDSGCSRHMRGNISYLYDFVPFYGGYVKPQDGCSLEVPEGSGNTNPTASTSNPPAKQMETLIVETPILTVSSPVPTAWLNDSPEPSSTRNTDAPESSRNSNPTATSTNPPDDQLETLIVETLIPTASSLVPTVCFTNSQEPLSETTLISKRVTYQAETPSLDNILTLTDQFEDILGDTSNSEASNGVEADVSNMEITITSSPTPTLRIHRDHPKSQIIGHVDTLIQTRNKSKEKVWSLVDYPKGVRPIGTKWVLKNKKDERGIVIRNKARLVAQEDTQEEGIDYDKMDVKSAFLFGTIDEEVYVMQPPGF